MSSYEEMTGDDDLILGWEGKLQREIYAENALNRSLGIRGIRDGVETQPNWEYLYQKAAGLGIDRLRVGHIACAAQADIDWHGAMRFMRIRGIDQEIAEEIVDYIAINSLTNRHGEDYPYKLARKRFELIWSLIGLGVAIAAIGVTVIYWSRLVPLLETVRACWS